MDFLMALIVLAGIAVSIANKKNAAKTQKRNTAFPEKGNPVSGSTPARNAQKRAASSKEVSSAAGTTTLSQRPSAPGTSKWPWPTKQGSAQPQRKTTDSSYGGMPRYTHVVTSTLEGGHTHTESSMTGEESCPPPKMAEPKHPETGKGSAQTAGALLNFQSNSVLQGVLFAEILGKPKSLQRD